MFTSEVMINKNKFPHQGQNELFNVDFDNNGWILDYLSRSMFVRPEVCACECRDVRAKRECLEQVKLEIHGNARTLRIILTAIRAGPGQRTRVSAAAPWPPSRAVAPASYLITTPPAPVSRCPASQLPVRVTGVSSVSSVTRRPASAGR